MLAIRKGKYNEKDQVRIFSDRRKETLKVSVISNRELWVIQKKIKSEGKSKNLLITVDGNFRIFNFIVQRGMEEIYAIVNELTNETLKCTDIMR